MTTLLRILRSFAATTWVGGLIFFGFVTKVAFSSLPNAHEAGIIVRGTLSELHHIGLIAGLLYLLLTLTLLATQRDSHPARAAELVLVIVMLCITLYSQFSIMPRMENDRLSVGGDIATASQDLPAVHHFERLHGLSVKMEGAVLIEGLLLLVLAPIRGREDFDRFVS